jgi:hypothetical protein
MESISKLAGYKKQFGGSPNRLMKKSFSEK